MTSNQIAAEANAIRKEELEETKRHNQETEFISTDKNQIEANYNAVTASLKQQELELKERLEMLKAEITRSQGDEKNRIQAEYNGIMQQLNDIHQQQADTEELYKTNMAGNAALTLTETVRSNMANEEIRRKANTIKEHEVDIEERKQQGETPLSRAQIINLSSGMKSPFGLLSQMIYGGNEARIDMQKRENSDEAKSSANSSKITNNKRKDHSSGKF